MVLRAEKAIEQGNPGEVISFLQAAVALMAGEKFEKAVPLQSYDENDVQAARRYVHAMLDFVLVSARLYLYMQGQKGHAD